MSIFFKVQYNHTKNKILNEPIKFVTISQSVKFMLLPARIIVDNVF